jgi:hypothetical protein
MSAEGMPSETPGHTELTEEQLNHVRVVRQLGKACHHAFALLEDSPETDKRWLAIARTDMQKGLMSAVRAITKPGFF